MSSIDMRTVIFTGVVIEVVCTIVVIALWRQSRGRFDGMGLWVVDFVLQTAGLSLIVLRGNIPDWMSIILSNVLLVTGSVFGYWGLEQFIGRRTSSIRNYGMLAGLGAFTLIHTYYLYVDPDLTARSVNTMGAFLLMFVQCAWLALVAAEGSMRRATRWVGLVFVAYVVMCAVRIARMLAHPFPTADYFHPPTIEVVTQLLLQVQLFLLVYSLALMISNRLHLAVRVQEEKFSKAFHSSPYAIVLTQLKDGKVLEANAGLAEMTGYPLGDVVGKTTFDLHLWAHEQVRDDFTQRLREEGKVRSMEVQYRHRSGALRTGLLSAEVITIANELCILASINDITARKEIELERERLISEREKALSEVKVLSGMLPICAACKRIRDDRGYWNQIESYIKVHSQADFSHGICPECMVKLYPDYSGKESDADDEPSDNTTDATRDSHC